MSVIALGLVVEWGYTPAQSTVNDAYNAYNRTPRLARESRAAMAPEKRMP